jgi:hypothetical protein
MPGEGNKFKPKTKNGKSIIDNVKEILEMSPEARNNDRILMAYYWAVVDEVDFRSFDSFVETFAKATPPSSLQRSRQLINYECAEETYLPTDEKILKQRIEKAEVMRSKHGRMKLLGDVNHGG